MTENNTNKTDNQTIFIPLFNNCFELTRRLSDAQFGRVIRMLIATDEQKAQLKPLPPFLATVYDFLSDGAGRVIEHRKNTSEYFRNLANKRWEKNKNPSAHSENNADD